MISLTQIFDFNLFDNGMGYGFYIVLEPRPHIFVAQSDVKWMIIDNTASYRPIANIAKNRLGDSIRTS